ncbi:uncharacterized protein G6M90_00g052470 [Metarhizium brunneum]|uniref:Uncharacterized protein n=1 Tax=Metarhizium brunneum TaxID=500148 RepID=A0A7D5UXR5_9HYPO
MTFDGDKTLYLHARCPSQGGLSDFWAFNIETLVWIEIPPAPATARRTTSIAFCQAELYRMGGFHRKTELGGNINIYEPSVKGWTTTSFKVDEMHGPV